MPDFDVQTERRFMTAAIEEARKSKNEDGRAHPCVGAVLVNRDGTVVMKAHRGEKPGAHSEYQLFEKMKAEGIDPTGMVLFVTLEPCTQRGIGKTPCAVRVLAGKVATVYIGTLDPNPGISGRGELFLQEAGMDVRRFPSDLQAELRKLNGDFFAAYEHLFPASGLLQSDGNLDAPVEPLVVGSNRSRDSLLLSTARMLDEAKESALFLAGQLSWLKEIAMTVLLARQRGVRVDIAAARGSQSEVEATFGSSCRAAVALGASVSIARARQDLRGIIVDEAIDRAQCLVLEKRPAPHGTILRDPHDSGLIGAICHVGRAIFGAGSVVAGSMPRFRPLTEIQLIDALRRGVSQYSNAPAGLVEIQPEETLPLSLSLERLKLLRARQTRTMVLRYAMDEACLIADSPWPITPPVIEKRPNGSLVVIDGTHRVYLAMQEKRPLHAIVVECGSELPSLPVSWKDTAIRTEKLSKAERYDTFRKEHFRPCGDAFGRLARAE